ncbi:MAG: transcription antitermination factor NusB [Gemmatimonadales bacterium]
MRREGVAARRAALEVLRDVQDGAYADRSAATRFRALSPRDRGLAQELAYGAIRLRARLDTELARWSDRPLRRLDDDVVAALRLGLYQVRETRIPPHAAVSTTLDAARGIASSGARGLINAVLRRAVREGRPADLFPALEADPGGYLSTWGSHPEWLVRRWLDRHTVAEVERLVELDNRPPPVTFRLLGDAENLDVPGLEPLPGHPGMAVLRDGDPARVVERGVAIAQDPAASAVVDYVSPGVEGPLLDACAAPGGKTVGLWHASRARPLIAADVSLQRLRSVRALAADAGAAPWLVVMDGRRPAVRSARTVLLDAPCSGTGVLRRRPDARWRLRPERLAALVELQRELLAAAADLLEPGGLLVYATCSLEPEENEDQVRRFLAERPEFRRDPEGPLGGEDLHVMPWECDSDGAYASRLRKRQAG